MKPRSVGEHTAQKCTRVTLLMPCLQCRFQRSGSSPGVMRVECIIAPSTVTGGWGSPTTSRTGSRYRGAHSEASWTSLPHGATRPWQHAAHAFSSATSPAIHVYRNESTVAARAHTLLELPRCRYRARANCAHIHTAERSTRPDQCATAARSRSTGPFTAPRAQTCRKRRKRLASPSAAALELLRRRSQIE